MPNGLSLDVQRGKKKRTMPLAQKGLERANSSSKKDKQKTQAFLRLVNPRTIITYRERDFNFKIKFVSK